MHLSSRPKAVVLGLTTKVPLAGMVLLTMQYVIGLKRLGFDVYYVEEHGKAPWMLMNGKSHEDGPAIAAGFIARLMERFDVGERNWAFWSPDRRADCYGMSEQVLDNVLREAAVVLNLHGGTVPRPEHYASGRLVYVGTDPVEAEVSLDNGDQGIVEFLEPHAAFFTWGQNYGNADCDVPVSERFRLIPTRQPMVMDLWEPFAQGPAETCSTIANWRQPYRTITFRGEVYHWSKHLEFLKFVELPLRCDQPFELALTNIDDQDRLTLTSHKWRVRDAAEFNVDLDGYRQYIGQSRGEFSVANDQNVRLRSGWFSDRSASYLACGRPVITQETGFSNVLPTGKGLFGFSTQADVEDAVERMNADYRGHSQAAKEIAREWFDYRVVLGEMLDHLDCRPSRVPATA